MQLNSLANELLLKKKKLYIEYVSSVVILGHSFRLFKPKKKRVKFYEMCEGETISIHLLMYFYSLE